MGCGSSKGAGGEAPAAPASKKPAPAASTPASPARAAPAPPAAPQEPVAPVSAPSPTPAAPPPAAPREPAAPMRAPSPTPAAPPPPAASQEPVVVSPTPAAAPPAAEEIPPKADRPAEPEEEKVANDSKAEAPVFPDVPLVEGSLPEDAVAVVILGGPGSGKGTLAEKLVAKYSLHHLSSGDLLRAEVASGSELGKVCADVMKQGGLVPDIVGCNMLKNAMISSGKKAFLLDGFPRSMGQATTFEAEVMSFDFCVYLECSEEVMKERLLGRGKTSGRADDNEETIMKRFQTFQKETAPVTTFFGKAAKIHVISAEQTPEDVFSATVRDIGEKMQAKLGVPADAQAPAAEASQATEAPVFPEVPLVDGSLPEDAVAVVILGGPGSGKGTLAEKLVAKYGLHHLSSGDLLRAEVASGSELGKVCADVMKQGGLVPDIVGCNMLKNAMISSGKKAFLLDGFPRSMGQATTFEAEVMSFDFCVYLECSEEVMKERLLGRGKTSGRADDNEETIMKRFQTFQTETAPVTEFFMTASKLYAVSAEQSPEEVFEEAVKKIGVKLDEKVGTPQTDAVSTHAGEADPADETDAAASTVVNESPNPEAAPKESQAAEVAAP